MIVIITDEDFENLITSYDFITKMEFTSKDQVKLAIEYCMNRNKLTEDTLNYLLELLPTLPENVETTESNQDWEITGASAN
jgi:hypothetical protein